jgi:hypothetical protein
MNILIAALALSLPVAALAQTAAPAPSLPKAVPKVTGAGVGNDAVQQKKAPLRRSAAKAVEEKTPIDTDTSITLSPEDLEIAKRVYLGTIACELGTSVTITPNEKRPGFFTVAVAKGARFSMHPVGSRTGAIRLEDPKGGAMWLQLGNKSMLMSQKLGQRLADECMSAEQVTYADELKKNPIPGILDTPKIVVK